MDNGKVLLKYIQNITILRVFFGNVIFAIIARLLLLFHLNFKYIFFNLESKWQQTSFWLGIVEIHKKYRRRYRFHPSTEIILHDLCPEICYWKIWQREKIALSVRLTFCLIKQVKKWAKLRLPVYWFFLSHVHVTTSLRFLSVLRG